LHDYLTRVTAARRETIQSLREDLDRVRRERDAATEERDAARARARELEAELSEVRRQLAEALKLAELQKADLDRLRDAYDKSRPNCPERVACEEAEMAFKRVLETLGDVRVANDAPEGDDAAGDDVPATGEASSDDAPLPATPPEPKGKKGRRRHRHGRRRLDLSKLPVVIVESDPPEVEATAGEGFIRIGEEVSDRLGYRPASYFCLRLVRRKWVPAAGADRVDAPPVVEEGLRGEPTALETSTMDAATDEPKSLLVASLPESLWPRVLADPSAIAQNIVAKYDDVLPLNRQEHISVRQGFALPRSTQCGWLGRAYRVTHRIVRAMLEEARAKAFCIATDATSVPVRKEEGGCENWHVFALTADRDHVVFTYAPEHTSAMASSFLKGFHGYVLADASTIFDVLYREHGMIECGCWSHARRYFWRALETERERAMEAIAIIAKLFEIDRECRDIPMPQRTAERARRAKPILGMFDAWIEHHRGHVDPRGPLDKAIGYYKNQRDALRRFLDDGRLPLDNTVSERALKNVILGRHNWLFFANETGLRWYTTFRSLIASCALHGLNAQDYLEKLLRLAPHWPVTRMLELAPKYWATTIAGLDARQRAILVPPWEMPDAAPETAQTILRAA